VLHSLLDAALQWTRSGNIKLAVTSVQAPATSRIVLRFRIDNSGSQIDDSLRRRMFEDEDEVNDDSEICNGIESLKMKTAAIVAESLGGKLGLQRGQAGELVARFWVELTTVTG
jgi:hypothetical protein